MDTAVLTALLSLANYLFGVDQFGVYDFGWRRLNPSPWFLLPILIGCRYGFTAGILSGVLGTFVVWCGVSSAHIVSLADFIRVFGVFSAGMILLGGICGEVCHGFRKKELQLAVQNQHYQDRLRKLDMDLFFLREAKAELERLLATHDAELATLDTEIRRLFESEGDDLYQDILLLLNRQTRVSDAAIYTVVSPTELRRKAALGRADDLPERLSADAVEMVALALRNKKPVSIPEFWQRPGGEHTEHLMAVPLLDSKDNPTAILLVTGMPFIALTKKTLHVIALICRWAARVVEINHDSSGSSRPVEGTENQRLFTAEFFRQNLELSLQSYRQHELPSAVALFLLPNHSKSQQKQFEALIMASVRGGDFPAEIGLPVPHLAILLPLCGERGANIFIERILADCRKDPELGDEVQTRLITFDQVRTFEELWIELTNYVAYAGDPR